MARLIVLGFLDALSTLTLGPTATPSSPPRRYLWFLVSFPLIGLLFGLLGMAIVLATHSDLPVFTAWFLPLFWLAFAGGSPFSGLCESANAMLTQDKACTKSSTLNWGMLIGLLVLSGKMFALLQAQVIDTRSLSLIVLLIPVVSRYTALLAALEYAVFIDSQKNETSSSKPLIVGIASLLVLSICAVSAALGLALIIVALFSAVTLHLLASRRLESIPPCFLGALIEISELAMLWISIILASLGYNLAFISVI